MQTLRKARAYVRAPWVRRFLGLVILGIGLNLCSHLIGYAGTLLAKFTALIGWWLWAVAGFLEDRFRFHNISVCWGYNIQDGYTIIAMAFALALALSPFAILSVMSMILSLLTLWRITRNIHAAMQGGCIVPRKIRILMLVGVIILMASV